jgi:multiple sugar transport system substrate-binding protein
MKTGIQPIRSAGPGGGSLSRRSFLKLLGAGGSAALLASCAQPAQAPAPATLPPPTAAAGGAKALTYKGSLDLWDWEFPSRQELFKQVIAEWSKTYPDIAVNLQALPWGDMETKILAVATAKNGPPMSNVFFFWRYELERAGVLNPFPEDFTDWSDRISAPFSRDEGKIRALPSGWYMDMVYYNKEMLEKEGIKPTDIPKKWDDFIKLAQQLVRKDADGKFTRLGCVMNDYWQHEYSWFDLVYQQGGWMYSEDGTKALWDQEAALNALQFIQDWYHKHQIDSLEFPVGYGSFGNEQTALFLGSGWNTTWILNDYPQFTEKWDCLPAPTLSGKPEPSWGLACPEEGMQVFSTFPEDVQAACTEFIRTLAIGEKNEIRFATAQYSTPDSKKLLSHPDVVNTKGVKAMADTLQWRINPGERPIEAEKLWRTMFDKVTLEKGDVKAAAQEAAAAINIELPKKKRYFTERNYKPPAA